MCGWNYWRSRYSLGGCGVGTAVGLGIASIPGCGVGAIIGGIAGDIGGAATACGSNNDNGDVVVYINMCEDEATRDACVEEDRISIEDAYPLFDLDSDG